MSEKNNGISQSCRSMATPKKSFIATCLRKPYQKPNQKQKPYQKENKMTHDEVVDIAIVKDLNKLIRKQMKAIDAVFELHKPQEITLPNGEWGTNCGHCDIGFTHPCPTIQAIEKELQ